MPIYIDSTDYPVEISKKPKRIISLVPSLTLLLYDLGLEEKITGVTKFCVHPNHLRKLKEIVGGTKILRYEVIKKLKPDLIIANKEENNEADVEILRERFPVYVTDIKDYRDALEHIDIIGKICDKKDRSDAIKKTIEGQRIAYNSTRRDNTSTIRVLYAIWNEPFMVAGADTFINSMIEEAGWDNVMRESRYPAVSIEYAMSLKPDYIFLSSEPYPFKEKHKSIFGSAINHDRIILVDGEMFSWYGPRLEDSFRYFETLKKLMH